MCKHVKTNGTQCQAKPVKGSEYCFRHNKDFKEQSIQASRKGGLNRRLQGAYGDSVKLTTPHDVTKFLGLVINNVWTGKIPVQVGTSMGFLTRCWLDAYEASDVEVKLKRIEQKLDRLSI
ncbi:MAG: hypothetical protein Q8O68_01450 [Candidatus Daviesbacteria bacterium]|nr:hypothetical protein [Candidatus Daviesbacteria bacterium]